MNSIPRWVWIFVAWLLAGNLADGAAPDPKLDTMWRRVAQSHLIVTGTPQVPIGVIRKSIQSEKYKYVQIPVRCDLVLKGTRPETLRVQWHTGPARDSLTSKEVLALDGKSAILFLVESDEEEEKIFFFADDTASSFSKASPELTERVRAEVKAQRDLLDRFDRAYQRKEEPLYSKVKARVDATTRKDTERDAFRDLEALGPKGVPAMILLMDDRRELPEKWISKNGPGGFEDVRHYKVQTVTDAVAAILNQVTGEDFGPIRYGGSERERREAVNGWRVYLHHLKSGQGDRAERPSRAHPPADDSGTKPP